MPFRPLTNPTTAEISKITLEDVEISAYCVNTSCKIGYIRLCMRPLLQAALPCLADYFSVCQDVDFVNILKGKIALLRPNLNFFIARNYFSIT